MRTPPISHNQDDDPQLDAGLRIAFGGPVRGPNSVLEAVERLTGEAPRILLREEDSEQGTFPLIDPSTSERRSIPQGRGSYQLLGEIARGGMGVVLKGHDTDLGRDVALKVLHKELAKRPEVLQRFVEEAQIGGQLQHPGIVPVYELGLMADERPYFTMKLVKGRTLAALLAESKPTAIDRRRLLDVFENVCQTMAYAHSRGVIHRDLKPANVMVGAFGEVQVVDWGLAKVLRQGGTADERRQKQTNISIIETVRTEPGSNGSHSLVGSVMGTPAYMSPEQARGDVERLDERSDVFSLGAILCEILTGAPPYLGETEKTLVEAANARLDDARKRLDGCDADTELIALCRECLTPAPSSRPRSAEVVAQRIHGHLISVEERARAAQIDAAEARVRALEERRARKLTVGLAVSVLVTALVAGGGWTWISGERTRRERDTESRVGAALNDATLKRGEGRWAESLAAVERARGLADSGVASAELRIRVASDLAAITSDAQQARARADLARDNEVLLAELADVRQPEGDRNYPTDWAKLDVDHRAIFRRHGLDLDGENMTDGADAVGKRGIPIEIAAALDEWAFVRSRAHDKAGEVHLSSLARRMDPDAARSRLRDALLGSDVNALRTFAANEDLEQLPATTLLLLGKALRKNEAWDEAIAVLRQAQQLHAGDFMLTMSLARALLDKRPSLPMEAARYYTAALALRPKSVEAAHELGSTLSERLKDCALAAQLFRNAIAVHPEDGHVRAHLASCLMELGIPDAALSMAREACELAPTDAYALEVLGTALYKKRDLDGAIAAGHKAIDLEPEDSSWRFNLGLWLGARGDLDGAIAALHKAIELDPQNAQAHAWLGASLYAKGDLDGAVAAFHKAIEIDPKLARAHASLGGVLAVRHDLDGAIAAFRTAIQLDPTLVAAYLNLGSALREKGELGEAIKSLRMAIKLDPSSAPAHTSLGIVLDMAGQLDDGLAELRSATELDPKYAAGQESLGTALRRKGDLEHAIEAYSRALEMDPNSAVANLNLGRALREKGDLPGALRAFRNATRIDPTHASAFAELGNGLWRAGDMEGAIEACRKAIRLDPKQGEAYNTMGNALVTKGEIDEAIDAFRNSIALQPELPGAYLNLGALLNDNKHDHDGAIKNFRKAIGLDPKLAGARFSLGIALRDRGDIDGEVEAFHEAIELDPRNADYRLALSTALNASGDLDGAIEHARTVIQVDAKEVRAYMLLGRALSAKGDAQGAAASFREASEIAPGYAAAQEELGTALQATGDLDGAIKAWRRTIEIDPKSLTSINRLAWLFATCGDISRRNAAEAVRFGKREVELAPTANSFNDLGAALCCAEKWSDAIQALDHSVELTPGHDEFSQYQLAVDRCFLANAHAHLGELERAREEFTLAKGWCSAHPRDANAVETARFLEEARIAIEGGAKR